MAQAISVRYKSPGVPPVPADVLEFLTASGAELAALEWLLRDIRERFVPAHIRYQLEKDPEEGWTQVVLTVDASALDPQQRVRSEERFYQAVDAYPAAGQLLKHLVVSFE